MDTFSQAMGIEVKMLANSEVDLRKCVRPTKGKTNFVVAYN